MVGSIYTKSSNELTCKFYDLPGRRVSLGDSNRELTYLEVAWVNLITTKFQESVCAETPSLPNGWFQLYSSCYGRTDGLWSEGDSIPSLLAAESSAGFVSIELHFVMLEPSATATRAAQTTRSAIAHMIHRKLGHLTRHPRSFARGNLHCGTLCLKARVK